jgi:DNA-directed RNA polymerase specialized sigma24 family protein
VDELVERARGGDRDAFSALVQLTSDRMYAIATRILRDADLAEDALQGAFITAWKSLPTLRDPARFEAWLRRLLVHACYAEARRRRSWTSSIRVLPVDGPVGPTSAQRCRPRLARPGVPTPDGRATGGLSCTTTSGCLTEIADAVGIPAGTAARLHYATKRLKAIEADPRPPLTRTDGMSATAI